jgi:hypothetical protein
MQRGLWLAVGILLLAPAVSRSENCAWLNAATAGGLLGGEVSMKVVHTSPEDTTCEFTLKHDSSVSTLKIAVHTMNARSHEFPALLAQCGTTGMPLRAVGNEALECTRTSGSNQVTEQLVSRVRERAFVLTWAMPKPHGDAASQSQDEIRDKFRNVAEQVAGSLF